MKKISLLIVVAFACTFLSAQNIYTIANNLGTMEGATATDAAGNVYIPDWGGSVIEKVDAVTGAVTIIAGTGIPGYNGDGIAASTAQLNYPDALAIDAAGNIYIAEYSAYRIRKITASTGLISTVAGTGGYGFGGENVLATSSVFGEMTGVAVDAAGNIYFSDLGNARVREIDASTGNVHTLAGTGTQGYNGDGILADTAQLNIPVGIALDASNNVYVAERFNHRIRKIDMGTGMISTVAGNGTPGYNGDGIAATSANLHEPYGVAIDAAGNIYIADSQNDRIRKVDGSGNISTVAGTGVYGYSGDGGLAVSAQIANPRGISVDGCGNIYISDRNNSRVRKVTGYLPAITSTDVSCNNACNGTVAASASGGVSPYTYSWSGGLGSGANHSGVCAGNYTVTITDAVGCLQNISVVITQPNALTATVSHTDASSCFMSDGRAIVVASGGTMPYSYLWSNTDTNDTANGLAAGTYSVTVTDANSCTTTQTVAVMNNTTPPAAVPICMVTVDLASQYNVIVWDKTSATHVDSFIVYREITTNNYSRIGAVPYDSLSQFVDTVRTLYFPNTGDPNAGTYRYKIKTMDSCGNVSAFSPYHNTIYISNNNGTFSWTQLYTIEGSGNPVLNYVLLRDDFSTGNWLPVASVAGTQQTVTDPNYSTYSATGSWRVETFWNITCTPTMRLSSGEQVASLNTSYSNTQTNNLTLGVNNNTADAFAIYPTIGNGIFTLEVADAKNSRVEIYSMPGALVYSSTLTTEKSEINLSGMSKGMYLVHVISEKGISVKKIVVQ